MGRISEESKNDLLVEFQTGCESAFTKIVEQFEHLTLNQVRMHMEYSNYKHLQRDIESDVSLILWNAAKKFDSAKGSTFPAYLKQCVKNVIRQKIKKRREESKHLEKFYHSTFTEFVFDPSSDGDCEISVKDSFPCKDESILSELAPIFKPKELAILRLICNDNDVWHKSGNLNNAAVARKLGLSRETVRKIVRNLAKNQSLRSAISELTPR